MSDRGQAGGETGASSWRAAFAPAGGAVRPFLVGRYVGWEESSAGPIRRREMPVPMVPVIFGFGERFTVTSGGAAGGAPVRLASFVAGAHRGHAMVEQSGRVLCVQANLTREGACRLLRRPMHEISDRVVACADLFGPAADSLAQRLGNAGGWAERFALVDAFLAQGLAERGGLTPAMQAALAGLERTGGRIGIGRLAEEAGLTRKRLIEEFRRQVGLPPKLAARVLRLQHAVRQLAGPAPDLPAIALEAGYYDQAHFNRDFREFVGLSPGAYRRELRSRPALPAPD